MKPLHSLRRLVSALACSIACSSAAAEALPGAPGASAALRPTPKSALPAELPLRRASEGFGAAGYGGWMILLALAVGGLWLVRSGVGRRWMLPVRAHAGTQEGRPSVVAVRALGPHTSLQVVRWNGKDLLLGCSQQCVTVLDSRPAGEEGVP